MNTFKYFITSLLGLLLVTSCQDDTADVGDLTVPTNLTLTTEIVGLDADNPNGDGSGTVHFKVSADNALAYHFVYNGETRLAPKGEMTYDFAVTGLNIYTVTVIAFGTGGNSTSKSIQLEVLALYEPPADLLDMLVGNDSRTWRIKAEANGHFGLGPVEGSIPTEWYGAGPNEKSGTGMYDDRYIFNKDGTFTHITNSENDDNTGTVFGRKGLIDELGGAGGTENGDDIENYPLNDYTEQWTLSAPGGKETISLTGTAFMGYYTGGNHKYEIFSRSATEMLLRTTDANEGFDWWFILTNQEPGATDTTVVDITYTNLIWEDNFDTDGAPNTANWTYDLGTGDNGWGNSESQHYTDRADNVIVADGVLKITAKKESFIGSNYTSARLKTQGLFDFTYGRIDVRAKLPEGAGTWPAIWMLGANFETVTWPACGEIDITEHVGNSQGLIHGTIHTTSSSGASVNSGTKNVSDASSEFHVYSVNWSENEISFLIDDEVYYTYKPTTKDANTWPFDADQFIILNVAMGGNFGGAIDAAFTESTMEIDYVKVYQ